MEQRLKNEDVNMEKSKVCGKRGECMKVATCEENTLDRGIQALHCLKRDERTHLLTALGQPLLPLLIPLYAELLESVKVGRQDKQDPTEEGNQLARECRESPNNVATGPQAESLGNVSRSPSDLQSKEVSFVDFLRVLVDVRESSLETCQQMARLLLRVALEPVSSDLLSQFERCSLVHKKYQDRLFVGVKAVVHLGGMFELSQALLSLVHRDSGSRRDLAQRESQVLRTTSHIDKDQGLNGGKQESNDQDCSVDQEQKMKGLAEQIEPVLFVFVLLFENRLLELVSLSEVAHSNVKYFGGGLGLFMTREFPDLDICIVILPPQNSQSSKHDQPKVKLTPETARYFKVRRSAKKIPFEEFIEKAEDTLISSAFAKLRSFNSSYSFTRSFNASVVADGNRRVVSEFRKNMAMTKKKSTPHQGNGTQGGGMAHLSSQSRHSHNRHPNGHHANHHNHSQYITQPSQGIFHAQHTFFPSSIGGMNLGFVQVPSTMQMMHAGPVRREAPATHKK